MEFGKKKHRDCHNLYVRSCEQTFGDREFWEALILKINDMNLMAAPLGVYKRGSASPHVAGTASNLYSKLQGSPWKVTTVRRVPEFVSCCRLLGNH